MDTPAQLIDTTKLSRQLSKGFQITELQARLLTQIMVQGGNISRAAKVCGTDRQVHYTCLGYSEGYRTAYRSVIVPALGLAAAGKLMDRAINGDPVIYKGEIAKDSNGEPLREYSDLVQIFASKLGGLTDQTSSAKTAGAGTAATTVIVNMPQNDKAPSVSIEHNNAEGEEERIIVDAEGVRGETTPEE